MKPHMYLMVVAMLGTACSGNDVPSGPPAQASTAGNLEISADYLAGQWCYLYYDAGGERSEENIDYVFSEDGTLMYQNNSDSPVDRPGHWKLDGNALSVGPAVWMVAKTVHSVDEDRFALANGSVQAVFARGVCPEEDAP